MKKPNHMQELRQLRKANARLKEKIAQLEVFLGRGLPHKEVLDTYVRFINLVGRASQDAILQARQEFFQKLEPWLQSFLTYKEVEQCNPQQESGASPSEEPVVEATSESTPEATETEPIPSPTPENSSEPGLSPDPGAS